MAQIFFKVINNALTVSLLISVILAIRLVCRKIPKWISCLLWGLVAVKLIVPVSVVSVLSLIPTSEPISTQTVMRRMWENPAGMESVKPSTALSLLPGATVSVNPVHRYINLAMIIWLIGLMAMLLYAIVTYMQVRRRVKTAVRLEGSIYECDDIVSPFILGIIRPKIFLPSSLSEDTKKWVLKHELAHLKRRDYLWKPLGFMILSIYWFQPFCLIAYILFCRDMEYACDEKAMGKEGENERADYCEALLTCSMSRARIAACPVAFGENGVKARVKNLLHYKKPTFFITTVSLLIFLLVALCFATSKKKPITRPFEDISNDPILTMSLDYAPNLLRISEEDAGKLNQALSSTSWKKLGDDEAVPEGEFFSVFVFNKGEPFRMNFYVDGFVTYEQDFRTTKYRIGEEAWQAVYEIVNPKDLNAVRDSLEEFAPECITTKGVWDVVKKYQSKYARQRYLPDIQYEFGDFYVSPRGYDFDGETLFYYYDVVNQEDPSAVFIKASDEEVETTYCFSENHSTYAYAIIHFNEYRDLCNVEIGGKGTGVKYSCSLPVNIKE